jgi:hypothetical protein
MEKICSSKLSGSLPEIISSSYDMHSEFRSIICSCSCSIWDSIFLTNKQSICINLFTEVQENSDTFEKENSDIDDLLKSLVNRCENYIELFDCIVNLFLWVAFSQFWRDYLFFCQMS